MPFDVVLAAPAEARVAVRFVTLLVDGDPTLEDIVLDDRAAEDPVPPERVARDEAGTDERTEAAEIARLGGRVGIRRVRLAGLDITARPSRRSRCSAAIDPQLAKPHRREGRRRTIAVWLGSRAVTLRPRATRPIQPKCLPWR